MIRDNAFFFIEEVISPLSATMGPLFFFTAHLSRVPSITEASGGHGRRTRTNSFKEVDMRGTHHSTSLTHLATNRRGETSPDRSAHAGSLGIRRLFQPPLTDQSRETRDKRLPLDFNLSLSSPPPPATPTSPIRLCSLGAGHMFRFTEPVVTDCRGEMCISSSFTLRSV